MTSVSSYSRLPPGFRFHPTDEELVDYYLRKKVGLEKFELDVIVEIDLNKLEPWDLHERCKMDSTQTEWFFFSYKDKKYPTGTRTNRATTAGFWKATGRDKPVYSNSNRIGMRKTLVFYKGRAPHGHKTDWIMHEYRMDESEVAAKAGNEGWVICRVFEKRSHQHKDYSNATEKDDITSIQKLETGDNSPGHCTSNQPLITCKQELEIEDSVLTQNTCLQVPDLESPKNSSNYICSYPSFDTKKILTENCKRPKFFQPFSLELTAMAYSKSFLTEDSSTDYADNRHRTEWNLTDNSIFSKEMWFTRNNISVENQCALQGQHMEYPASATYEMMDLWNFGRY